MNESEAGSTASGLLARRFLEGHPVDAARVMDRFPGHLSAELLADLPLHRVAPVVVAMSDHVAADCLAAMEPHAGARVMEELDLDQASALLRRIDAAPRSRLLAEMPPERAELLDRLLSFPPGTAGALMDPNVLSAPEFLRAGEALERVRAFPRFALYYLYLVDDSSRLSGVVNLRELMLAKPDTPLAALMAGNVESLPATADHRAILVHPGWTEFHALPVVDSGGRFVGAVRYETLRRLEGQSRTGAPVASVAASLGELYWVGLSGILRGLGQVALPDSRRPPSKADTDDA